MPLYNWLSQNDLLVGFDAEIHHVPEEEGIARFPDLHGDGLIPSASLDFFNILLNFNLPGLLHETASIVKNNEMLSIQHDGGGHEYAALRLPVDEILLGVDQLQRGDGWFDDADLLLVDGHQLICCGVDGCEGGVQVVLVQQSEVRDSEEEEFVGLLADDVVLVV